MTFWIDIASIVFTCVTMNHLGLVKAIEDTFEIELPIFNCVKCSVFWFVLCYSVVATHRMIQPLAISFLCSYLAVWLELFEGYIDTLYLKLYAKIYPDSDNDTASAVRHESDTRSTVSEL